jgi:hypothetical protein
VHCARKRADAAKRVDAMRSLKICNGFGGKRAKVPSGCYAEEALIKQDLLERGDVAAGVALYECGEGGR